MPKWTEQQLDAIEASGGNIIVSAAAGSGKTAVLVERVIRLITGENAVDIDRLLVMTFTNAAAEEMLSRVSSRLEEMLLKEPENRNLVRQLSLLPSAHICTTDSFCINLVRDNFYRLDVSRDFTILEEPEADILARNAVNTVLDEYYDEGDGDFLSLSRTFSNGRNDDGLVAVIFDVYNYISAHARPLKWLRDVVQLYRPGVEFENSEWYKYLSSYINDKLEAALDTAQKCVNLIDPAEPTAEFHYEQLVSERDDIKALISAFKEGIDSFFERLRGVKYEKFYMKKKGCDAPPYAEELKAGRDLYKSIVKKLQGDFKYRIGSFKEDNEAVYPVYQMLCRVVQSFSNELFSLKKQRNAFTFSDIQHLALRLLMAEDENGDITRTEAAREISSEFYQVLVDEYQDTNEVQSTLYELVSNGSNLFMVGDVKQSIYRFRQAMPYIFNLKKAAYKDYDRSSPHGDAAVILDRNFRSRSDICNFTNFLFSRFMTSSVGEIDYTEREYLRCGAVYPDAHAPSIKYVITDKCKSSMMNYAESMQIARIINEKIASHEQVSDKNGTRDIRYGDFAVLLRNATENAPVYAGYLNGCGIPASFENKTGLLESEEIKLLISLLRVVDNPTRDVPLLAVMTSPIYGFTADDLTQIKLDGGGKKSFYSCVAMSESENAASFVRDIRMLSETSVTMSVSSFIRFLCREKNLFAYVNALGNARKRNANIRRFIDFAGGFDSSSGGGLPAFLRMLDSMIQNKSNIKSAQLPASDDNAVRIMSVHGSKGLEFPVVFLASAARLYNYRDLLNPLVFNEHYGIAAKRYDDELMCRTETLPDKTMRLINGGAAMSENLRVLYVAVTRAKEQFISLISLENLSTRIKKLAPCCSDGVILPALCRDINSDADILLMTALMHPNGEELRAYSPVPFSDDAHALFAEPSFAMEIELAEPPEAQTEQEAPTDCEPDPQLLSLIAERTSYVYPGIENSSLAAKVNASELDGRESDTETFALSKPAFMAEDGLLPNQKGTAMHTFMQFCDYSLASQDLDAEIQRLVSARRISEAQANSLNRKALRVFFSGKLARRVLAADNVYRELRLSSFLPASQLFDTDSDAPVLVRGFADCVFEENGGLVLIDYKTDRVSSAEELLSRYRRQIEFYSEVASKTLKLPVKSAALYSFHLSKLCEYR